MRSNGCGLMLTEAARDSRPTANRITGRRQSPRTVASLQAFLIGCGVPEHRHTVWLEAWARAQQCNEETHRAVKREVEQLEAVVADASNGTVSQEMARRLLRKANFDSLERYRSFEAPWAVECLQCGATRRVRLSDVVMGRVTCLDCPSLNQRVREAWDDLLRNRTGELTHEEVQALSSSTVFKARLQHHQLDLQLFVTDEKAGAVLSATAWHAALEAVLRRRIRRTFNLDVFLVFDYGARHTHPASQRQQSLSEDSGMAVQAQAPERPGRSSSSPFTLRNRVSDQHDRHPSWHRTARKPPGRTRIPFPQRLIAGPETIVGAGEALLLAVPILLAPSGRPPWAASWPPPMSPMRSRPAQCTTGHITVSEQRLSAPSPPSEGPGRLARTTAWIRRRRNALLSSALRGAAYATGGGVVGLAFWWLQQQL
jgi:hypothetical protein